MPNQIGGGKDLKSWLHLQISVRVSWGLGENEFRLCRKCGLGVWVSGACEGCVGIWFLTLRLLRVASGEFLSKYFLFLKGN